jgi:hypothetical protein
MGFFSHNQVALTSDVNATRPTAIKRCDRTNAIALKIRSLGIGGMTAIILQFGYSIAIKWLQKF